MTVSKADTELHTLSVDADYACEEERFYQTVLSHRNQLYQIACSYLRNKEDALEAIQEATFRAWKKRKILKNPAAFKPWIIRILIYICIDEQRRRKRISPIPEQMPEPSVQLDHRRMQMLSVLEKIKPKYRHILLLRYYNDMTVPEIARILDKPEGTIKTWQHQALKQLRKHMDKQEDWYNET
ncbi:sigma-70 family RNA polymerase sigma factor [Paenibacillus shenyangensis]|uniref:sigma-70 family RNA polymerase sigma factor n=1 Tax=Paenibacillus sp. A9 TaxID=1284352 RepID=UPI0003781215